VIVLYAESSAVLAWLLGEPRQKTILAALSAADRVVTSSLTLVECSRSLARARLARRIAAGSELAALQLLDTAAASWHVLDLSERVVVRAREAFPHEPVRTLDALHLASALAFHEALGAVGLLSLDDRIRDNAVSLGMRVTPAERDDS
jgi:uncharacterized protein with PIN domain